MSQTASPSFHESVSSSLLSPSASPPKSSMNIQVYILVRTSSSTDVDIADTTMASNNTNVKRVYQQGSSGDGDGGEDYGGGDDPSTSRV